MGVDVNKTVTANFIPMDPLTINATTFTLRQRFNRDFRVVTYTGSNVPLLIHSLNQDLFIATITTGAKSSAGIPLASNYIWNFTLQM
jgi:hypothetical protein